MAIITFFYVNGVPCEMAVQLFRVCKENAANELVEHFRYYYETYQNSKDVTHLGIYFDLKVEKHVYINGSRRNELEIVDFLHTDEPVGIGFGNLCTKSLRKKIQQIRQKIIYY